MHATLREAACQCGRLVIRCSGEPAAVSLCHCLDCQRRTGSVFGVGAFFAREQILALFEELQRQHEAHLTRLEAGETLSLSKVSVGDQR